MQRTYNAFAVRVQFAGSSESTGNNGRRVTAAAVASATASRKIVPAGEATEGLLCIEMRIRYYHDGSMSQLLEKLANVSAMMHFFHNRETKRNAVFIKHSSTQNPD